MAWSSETVSIFMLQMSSMINRRWQGARRRSGHGAEAKRTNLQHDPYPALGVAQGMNLTCATESSFRAAVAHLGRAKLRNEMASVLHHKW